MSIYDINPDEGDFRDHDEQGEVTQKILLIVEVETPQGINPDAVAAAINQLIEGSFWDPWNVTPAKVIPPAVKTGWI